MPTAANKNFSKKTKTDADRKLIKEVFAIDPVSWARYPDGKLVFISPTGQKFGYTQEQFDNIQDAVKIEKAAKKKLSRKKPAAKSAMGHLYFWVERTNPTYYI